MRAINLLGFAAGSLTTLAFVPQVVKTWRSRHARDVSGVTFAVFSAGVSLWLLYGLSLGSTPIILANAVTLALALTILLLKVRYK